MNNSITLTRVPETPSPARAKKSLSRVLCVDSEAASKPGRGGFPAADGDLKQSATLAPCSIG